MKEIELYAGMNIDDAFKYLKEKSQELGETVFGKFNDKEILSTDTIDEMYIKVLGITKAEHEEKMRQWHEDYERREAEHKASIPSKTEQYRREARGLVIESELEFWDKIVPIRLSDLYHGMEVEQTLTYCRIMRDETTPYDERLHKAYKIFMDSGHSGMSASLTASMIRRFCPHGEDLADAVMNFRFEDK